MTAPSVHGAPIKDLGIDFEPFIEDGVRDFITEGVDYHNVAATGLAAFCPTNFVLRSESGEVRGGLLGMIWGSWLHVTALWVTEALRGRGYGGRLLMAAEAFAVQRDCIGVFLETFSFQAKPFYERHGYSAFGTLTDSPRGHERYFLQKRLKHPG